MIITSLSILVLMPLASLALDPPLSLGLKSGSHVADLLKKAVKKVGAATPLANGDDDSYFCDALLYGNASEEVVGYVTCAAYYGLTETDITGCLDCVVTNLPDDDENNVFCNNLYNYGCGDHNCPCDPCKMFVANWLHCIGMGVGCVFCPAV